MNTAGQLREFLDRLEDNEPVLFCVLHKAERERQDRSFENRTYVVTAHPTIFLDAIGGGFWKHADNKSKPIAAIFLESK